MHTDRAYLKHLIWACGRKTAFSAPDISVDAIVLFDDPP